MISVLGLDLEEASRLLREQGYTLRLTQTRSRKGVEGNSARVLRQRTLSSGEVELVYSIFKTDYTYGG